MLLFCVIREVQVNSPMNSEKRSQAVRQAIQRQHKLEELAEEIILDEQHLRDFNGKREKNVECLTVLQTLKNKAAFPAKTWMCAGPFFIRLPTLSIEQLVQQDQRTIEEESTKLQGEIAQKIRSLEQLQK